MQFTLLWIMHISSIFWKIYFPMNAISLKSIRRTKYIHGMCLIAALLLPLISPLASHLEGGFTIIDFPPFTCDGRDAAVTFYVHLFPIAIILGVGTSLLVLIFWRLHMVLYTFFFYSVYSGTSLIRTPLGQKKVSWLVRCPDFRGCTQTWHLGQQKVSCLSRCPHFRVSWLEGFHCICNL